MLLPFFFSLLVTGPQAALNNGFASQLLWESGQCTTAAKKQHRGQAKEQGTSKKKKNKTKTKTRDKESCCPSRTIRQLGCQV